MQCPCGSGTKFAQCCEPFLAGKAQASSAEELLRARYSAYTQKDIPYIFATHWPATRHELDEKSTREWAESSQWQGLEILNKEESADKAVIEFRATYEAEGKTINHHERAFFEREKGKWYFVDAKFPGRDPFERTAPKLGRNDPCHCGSGKKFKKCCGTAA